MEEIAKALNEYCALLANLQWLQENGKLDADEDIGALAYDGSLQYASPAARQAFVAVMEIYKAERAYQASLPKCSRARTNVKFLAEYEMREQRERDISHRARLLSSELASSL